MKPFWVIALLLLASPAVADNIRFVTDNEHSERQDFRCKILKIDSCYVTAIFRHEYLVDTVMIHISRVYSLKFNNEYEHPNRYTLRDHVFPSVPGDMKKLRIMRVWDTFAEDYPDVACQWKGSKRKIRANIVSYDSDSNALVIRCRTKERTVKEVSLDGTGLMEIWIR